MVYVPGVEVSTVPVTVTVAEPPSLAVAPASVYVWYCSILTGLSPAIVITGAVASAVTITVLVAVEVLPEASVAA